MPPKKRKLRQAEVVTEWKSSRPKPTVDGRCYVFNAEEIAKYIDWHGRHPHCMSPRELAPGEELTSEMSLDELNPKHVVIPSKLSKPAPPIPEEFLSQHFGEACNSCEVSIASHAHHIKSTQSCFDENDNWCSGTVKDFKSRSHAGPYESMVEINRLRKEKAALAEEEKQAKAKKEKHEAKQAALEKLYVANRWGMIPHTKVGPWKDPAKFTKYTAEGKNLKIFHRQELDTAVEYAQKMYEEEEAEIEATIAAKKKKKKKHNHHHIADTSEKDQSGRDSGSERPEDDDEVHYFDKYEEMKAKLGGTEILEKKGESIIKFAEKMRQKAKKKKNLFDVSLDVFDACERGNAARLAALLALPVLKDSGQDANMIVNDEPLFMLMFKKANTMDVTFGTTAADAKDGKDRRDLAKVLKVLLNYGANINTLLSTDGIAPVHVVCQSGNVKLLKWLIDNGADLLLQSVDMQYSGLMLAVKFGHIEIIRLSMLHEMGPTLLQLVDKEGKTALHMAAEFGQTRACKFLLRVGADRIVKDKKGRKPGNLAIEAGYFPTGQIIIGYAMPPVNIKPIFNYLSNQKGVNEPDVFAAFASNAKDMFSMMSTKASDLFGLSSKKKTKIAIEDSER